MDCYGAAGDKSLAWGGIGNKRDGDDLRDLAESKIETRKGGELKKAPVFQPGGGKTGKAARGFATLKKKKKGGFGCPKKKNQKKETKTGGVEGGREKKKKIKKTQKSGGVTR